MITGQGVVSDPMPFPWWSVPDALIKKLAGDDPNTVIDNMMQWLQENEAELYFSFPESNLRQKVARFVKRTSLTEENYTGLLKAHLKNEVTA
ncbi:hypothetical protein ALO75_200163 [Pseudomonas syringae pv. coryli]|uniref:NADPH:quinone oxidoreductase n=1 Tax=Pseudomonas syringae pv. coryli TaxID=317659 RepID=A0A0P9QBL9_9PSED|nr:hypothetical protein ALO75_200163 [Pseudomonas syringae pv. coryli]